MAKVPGGRPSVKKRFRAVSIRSGNENRGLTFGREAYFRVEGGKGRGFTWEVRGLTTCCSGAATAIAQVDCFFSLNDSRRRLRNTRTR